LTVLAHMLVGGAVGSLVDGRGIALAAGLASHVPLDIIPHYEFDKMWLEAAIAVALLGGLVATGHAGTGVFWGAIGAAVPDLENLLWRLGILPGKWKTFPGHSMRYGRFLKHGRSLGVGHVWWQVALGALAISVIVMRAPRL
jgi:hypothetical protein